MHTKHWKVFAITLFMFTLGTSATSWASAPVVEWSRTFGGSGSDSASAIQQTNDGGFIFVGTSNSNDGDVSGNRGGWDGWVVRLDADGDITWQRSLGGSGSDGFVSVQQTMGGGFIVAGDSSSNDGDVSENRGDRDGWVVKLDADGEIEWQRTFGGSRQDRIRDIRQTADGGYVFTGGTYSKDGDILEHSFLRKPFQVEQNVLIWLIDMLLGPPLIRPEKHPDHPFPSSDVWIVRLDAEGEILWQRVLGGSMNDEGNAIRQTNDGGYIVAATSSSRGPGLLGLGPPENRDGGGGIWIIKLDSEGNVLWQRVLGGSRGEWARDIQQTKDGGYIVVGASMSSDGDVSRNRGRADAWVVKLDTDGKIEWQISLGGSGTESFSSVQQTLDGGYIVAGGSNSSDGDVPGNRDDRDGWIVKLDAGGDIEWQKLLGGPYRDGFTSIQQTLGGGYIVAGVANSRDGDVSGNRGYSDAWIIKLRPEM